MSGSAITGDSVDNLSDKGFRLAHFIVRDRSSAIQIVINAWNKLNARCKQEGKRAYWRDKYLKRSVTKISRTDCDTLQWLIYFESESYEKRQEHFGRVTADHLVIHYVKSLVQITTAMSSFYVAIALHRLLHDYSTSDLQRVYETLTERYLGADEYRRAKRFLMNKLTTRFGDLLHTVTTSHGEVVFDRAKDQTLWVSLVRECLNAFTPWSTSGHCLVPAELGQIYVTLPELLSGLGNSGFNSDVVETNRCHAFIHSLCYSRLVGALGFDPPDKRLALPRFVMDRTQSGQDNSRLAPPPPDLTPSEKEMIQANLVREAARRKRSMSQTLRILVDGVERSQIQLGYQRETCVQLEQGARLVEIWTQDEDGEMVLGIHLVGYSESHLIAPSKATIGTGDSRISLVISAADATGSAHLQLINHDHHRITYSNALFFFRTSAFRYAVLAAVFAGIGWTLAAIRLSRDLFSQRTRIERLERDVAVARSLSPLASDDLRSAEVVTQKLIPYDRITRGESADRIVASLPPQTNLLRLEIPVSGSAHESYRAVLKLLPAQKEIMAETLVETTASGTRQAIFTVPVTLLSDNEDYLVELNITPSAGAIEDARIFAFHVVKKAQ